MLSHAIHWLEFYVLLLPLHFPPKDCIDHVDFAILLCISRGEWGATIRGARVWYPGLYIGFFTLFCLGIEFWGIGCIEHWNLTVHVAIWIYKKILNSRPSIVLESLNWQIHWKTVFVFIFANFFRSEYFIWMLTKRFLCNFAYSQICSNFTSSICTTSPLLCLRREQKLSYRRLVDIFFLANFKIERNFSAVIYTGVLLWRSLWEPFHDCLFCFLYFCEPSDLVKL